MNKSYTDAFKGTAWYYARYRANYPDIFFEMVKDKFELDRNDRVLDLGCGTGQIAIPISRFVKEVVAMDPEPEMLAEGKIFAKKYKIKNIKWVEGGSEDLADMSTELGKFKLIVIGTAFHWMDREKTLDILYDMTEDGGGIVVVDRGNLFKEPVIDKVIKKWLGQERRAGSGFYKQPLRRYEEVISESRFKKIEFWEHELSIVNDIDWIVGNIYSSSMANPNVLGDRREKFEKDLRETLLKQNPSGKFTSNDKVTAIIAWR
ncbi:MAG TPA: class I SAM-dependent methyltransferase [Dehalococcoidales bacterium]